MSKNVYIVKAREGFRVFGTCTTRAAARDMKRNNKRAGHKIDIVQYALPLNVR